jgi:hypothetical protein
MGLLDKLTVNGSFLSFHDGSTPPINPLSTKTSNLHYDAKKDRGGYSTIGYDIENYPISGFVPEHFNYGGKFTTDIYSNIQLSKKVNFIFGADNIFNVHPDFAVNPQAKYWAGDNETGGPWDGVQMGYNGLRLFTKLAFRF